MCVSHSRPLCYFLPQKRNIRRENERRRRAYRRKQEMPNGSSSITGDSRSRDQQWRQPCFFFLSFSFFFFVCVSWRQYAAVGLNKCALFSPFTSTGSVCRLCRQKPNRRRKPQKKETKVSGSYRNGERGKKKQILKLLQKNNIKVDVKQGNDSTILK